MPEYLAPGVYVEEVDTGSKPIEGVSTSTAGMVGAAERGPVDVPILITSIGEYTRWFGERLRVADFSNNNGQDPHCYLPHAVEGFFTNGGKRVFVVRVLDVAGAVRASSYLFDRGTNVSAGTVLLRGAAELTGTTANRPPLVALDASALAQDDWIRIGNGSKAEYRRLAADPELERTLAALSLPFSNSHDAGDAVLEYAWVPDCAAWRLTDDQDVGAQTIGVRGLTADIGAIASGDLIEFIGIDSAELRFVVDVSGATPVSATESQASLRLDSPLTGAYSEDDAVQKLDITTATSTGTPTIDTAYTAADRMLFIANRSGRFALPTHITVIGAAGAADREARRTGVIGLRALSTSAYEDYPTGSTVEKVLIEPDERSLNMVGGTAVGDTDIVLDDVERLVVGQGLLVGPAGTSRETAIVRRITTASNQVALAAALTIVHSDGDPVVPAPKTLAADADSGAGFLSLDNRLGLEEGDVIRIYDASNSEYLTIKTIPGRPSNPVAPDAGSIVVTPAIMNDYAAGSLIEYQADPTPGTVSLTLNGAHAAAATTLTLNEDISALVAGQTMMIGTAGGSREAAVIDATTPTHQLALTSGLIGSYATGIAVTVPAPSSVTVYETKAGDDRLLLSDVTGITAGDILRVTTPSGEEFYHELATDPAAISPDKLELTEAILLNHPIGSGIVGRNPLLGVQAIDAGAWGNRLRISAEDEESGLVSRTTLTQFGPATRVRLGSLAGIEPGTVLELQDPDTGAAVGALLKVSVINRSTGDVTLAGTGLDAAQQTACAGLAAGSHLRVRSREFALTVRLLRQPDAAMPSRNDTVIDAEVFHYLSMDPRHSRYIHKVIGTTWSAAAGTTEDDDGRPLRGSDGRSEGESRYIRVRDLAQDLAEPTRTTNLESVRLGPEALVDVLPDGRERPARLALEDGDDSIPSLTDDLYVGTDSTIPEERTGLQALRNIEDVSIVAIPGRTSVKIQNALINHCELARYRFAVLDGPRPPRDTLTDVRTQRQQFDTKYAAIYYPWVVIPDPFPANLSQVANYPIPPSGHTLGVYARTDIERGVHKAPANEVVRGITGLQRVLNKEQHDILNPYPVNINVIRDFRNNNRGIRIYGGRVITSDSDWKYVNVRRLLIFIEASIERGLQWVVFEPNAEPLWARVRRSISNFLTLVWKNGALEGTKVEEAYFVKCDRTTMTQTDIDSGRLICLIGVAPVKPAEYVIIRIGLWTAHAED